SVLRLRIFRRNTGGDSALGEGGAEPIGIVALVGKELLGFRHGGQHQRHTLVVAHLPLAQEHDERASVTVADNVQLGVQTWPGPVHSDDLKTASPMTCSMPKSVFTAARQARGGQVADASVSAGCSFEGG